MVIFVSPLGKGVQPPPSLISTGVLVCAIVSLGIKSSSIMIGYPSISSLVLPLFKLRDEDPFHELSSTDLTEVSPSPSLVSLIQ